MEVRQDEKARPISGGKPPSFLPVFRYQDVILDAYCISLAKTE
jgi:hypothetical protein